MQREGAAALAQRGLAGGDDFPGERGNIEILRIPDDGHHQPFETKILLTDGKEVGWALCRDISVGGMQVLMDHSPGPAGTPLKLNVNPQANVPGFSCEGVVVRILEDGRGFSFRFTSLSNEAKSAIEKYIG